MALRFLSGSTRTFLLAGFALNVIFSPVKGLTPSRAFVAGFLTTLSFIRPGSVNRPLPRRLFLMTPPSESKTPPTCLRERPVSFEICVRTSDFVGAPPFFAIFPYSSNVCLRRAQGAHRVRIGAKNSTPERVGKPFFVSRHAPNGFFSSVCATVVARARRARGASIIYKLHVMHARREAPQPRLSMRSRS